jgi:NAD(P)H dehydrogenase (quinone)
MDTKKIVEPYDNFPKVVEDVGRKVYHLLEFEFDRLAGTIFVTGGHGVLSYRVASRLLGAGFPTVRVGALHADELSDLSKLGAEVADFSWGKDELYEKALSGVKTVFCTPPHTRNWDKDFELFLQACQRAKVKHIVKLSFLYANKPVEELQAVPLVRLHAKCDEMLMKSGIAYTIIGASHLMSNPVLYQVKNPHAVGDTVKLYGSSGGKVVNYVSPNDVAEVAVRALIAPHDHVDKIYELTGRISITEDEVARLLGKFMSKGVEYVEQPIETFEQEEKQSGTPSWLLHDIVSLEKIKALGHEGYTQFISSDFETICNHKPETFAEYLANVDAMSPREQALAA